MRVSTRCPRCGRIELAVTEVRLVAMPLRRSRSCSSGTPSGDRVADPRGDAWYVFDCTGCARLVVVAISSVVLVALVSVGVPIWRVPAEVLERGDGPGAPVSIDDVLDAILWLEDATADDAAATA